MEEAGKYIMDKFYDTFNKQYCHRNYAYAIHRLRLPNTGTVHSILNRRYHPRIRTLCRQMKVMGLVFGVRNILTNHMELVSNDADELFNFLDTQRHKRSGRSAFVIACRCCRRRNVTPHTFVRAFKELGYILQIGEYNHA
jgi:hypothetical protein